MAFRREIFRDHRFNEKLQRYAGYALWEDQQFSRQLFLEGRTLSVAEKGHVMRLSPWLTQPVKTMFAVRCDILDRQDHFSAF
jgi:hypothetical protein